MKYDDQFKDITDGIVKYSKIQVLIVWDVFHRIIFLQDENEGV
jgi:hypothetical protein